MEPIKRTSKRNHSDAISNPSTLQESVIVNKPSYKPEELKAIFQNNFVVFSEFKNALNEMKEALKRDKTALNILKRQKRSKQPKRSMVLESEKLFQLRETALNTSLSPRTRDTARAGELKEKRRLTAANRRKLAREKTLG